MEEVDEFGIPIKKPNQKKQSVDEFGIPIKKKVGTEVSTSTSTTKTDNSELAPKSGSLDSPSPKYRLPNDSDLIEMQKQGKLPKETPYSKPKFNEKELYDLDAKGKVILPSDKQVKKNEDSIIELNNIAGRKTRISTDLELNNIKNSRNLTPQEIEEINKKVDDKININGFWNTAKDYGTKALNILSSSVARMTNEEGLDEELRISTDPISNYKQQFINNEKEKGIDTSKLSKEDVFYGAKNLLLKEEMDKLKEDKTSLYIESLSDEEKNALKLTKLFKRENLNEKDKVYLANTEVSKQDIENTNSQMKEIITKFNKKEPLSESEVEFAKNYEVKAKELAKEYNDNYLKYQKNNSELGDVSQEYDLLKRDYDITRKSLATIGGRSAQILYGLATVSNDLLNPYEETRIAINDKLAEANSKVNNLLENNFQKNTDDWNGIGDAFEYVIGTISNQLPNLVLMATTGGSSEIAPLLTIGAYSAGNNINDLTQSNNEGKTFYSEDQIRKYAYVEGAGEMLETGTMGNLVRFNKFMKASFNNPQTRELFLRTAKESLANSFKLVRKGLVSENAEEIGTMWIDIIAKEKFLGVKTSKKEIADLTERTLKDTSTMSLLMYATPQIAHQVMKAITPKSYVKKLDENTKEILRLSSELKKTNLTKEESDIIKKSLDNKISENKKMLENVLDTNKDLDDEQRKKAIELELSTSELRNEAKSIKKSTTIDKDIKVNLLKELEIEYKKQEALRENIASGTASVLDIVSEDKKEKMKSDALKVLINENPNTNEANFTNAKIEEKAIQIYKTEQAEIKAKRDAETQNTTTENQQAPQPKAEVKTQVNEVNNNIEKEYQENTLDFIINPKNDKEYLKSIKEKYGVDYFEIEKELEEKYKEDNKGKSFFQKLKDGLFDDGNYDVNSEFKKRLRDAISEKIKSEAETQPQAKEQEKSNEITIKESEQKKIISLGQKLIDAVVKNDVQLRADGKGSKEIGRVLLETLTIAEEDILYNTNKEYKELFDKSEEGTLTEKEQNRMSDIYTSERTKKQVDLLGKRYQKLKQEGDNSPFVQAVDKLLQKKDETTSPSNIESNADVRPSVEPMGKVGVEQKPTTEIDTKESIQSANDVRAVEGETKVKNALEQIDKGVLQWNGDINSPRIDLGMSWTDIRKGEADLRRGKIDSVPAKRLLEAFDKAKEEGGYRYKMGTGGKNMRSAEFVTFEDLQRAVNENNLTNSEIEQINKNEEQLAKEYDEYFNSLDEETQNEILENYETKIDQRAEVSENTKSGESETNVSNKETSEISRKQIRKQIAEAKIDDLANALKDLLPKANVEGLKKQGLSQDDIIDFIAKNAKLLANTGIEIDEAIRQVISKLKENFDGIEVNIDDVKAKLEPKVEQEPFERKEGKKSLLTRSATGNSLMVKKAISKYSLDYEIESQEVAKANAERYVAEVGIETAFESLKPRTDASGNKYYLISGAESAFVYAEVIRQINANLESFTDEQLIEFEEANVQMLGETQKMFDEQSRSAGRFLSALGNIYQSSDGMYNLSIQVKKYKSNNGGTIPADILEKFTEANEKIKELEKQREEYLKIREEQQSARSIEEIIESISRKSKIDRSKPISDKAKRKAFTDKLRSYKTINKGNLNASTPLSLAYDGAIELICVSIDAGGKISDAIKQGLDYIRKQNLNKDEENQAIAKVFNAFEESERVERGIKLDDEGKLRIPHSILREKVESGIDNVDDLVKSVKEDVDELFPDEQFTEREIRDAITQYGKTVNPTFDEIGEQLSIMKSLGKMLSATEDAYEGKRPLKSGLQRRPKTIEERTAERKLKELMRDLPFNEADLRRAYKTALDAIKSRLTNEIADLDQQIANGEKRKGEKKAIEYDADANKLKAERDQKRQILDELVGKPELTEEERIEKAEILLEKSINDLQEKIDSGDIAYRTKPTQLNSAKLETLRATKKSMLQTMEQMRQDAGLAEMKRIELAKNARIKRVAELKRRLDEKDFSKKQRKPLPIDAELNRLDTEAMKWKEVYDKEAYKLELKNQNKAQKAGKLLLELLNIPKILSFTIDMSFIGIQGGIQFYRLLRTKPRKAMTIFTNTVKAMFNAKTENRYANELKSNPNYTLWKKSKLAITEVNYKTSAQEELFQHNLINGTLDALGDKLKENGYEKFGAFVIDYVNFTKIFERGQTYFLNQMRINRFDEGADMLRIQGKNELDDIEQYKKVAAAVNTLTGRANTSQSNVLANLRSLNGTLFSSFANWLSVINQLNPYWYVTLTPIARKMAISDLLHFVAAVGGFMSLAMLNPNEDDEEPLTIELDPRSSDFGLLKKGNLRIDPWQTKKSHVVFMARMMPYVGGVKNAQGEIVEFGVDYNDKNRLELAWQYMSNKFSPGVSNLIQYTSMTEEKEYNGVKFRENRFGEDYKMSKMFIPLYIQSFQEVMKEEPELYGKAVNTLNYLGLVNVGVYGGDDKGVKNMPDFDEFGNRNVKSDRYEIPERKER